jgi:hypothetical protein
LTGNASGNWSGNWTGFYVGGHLGAIVGLTSFSDPDGPGLYGGNVNTPGFLAGIQLGYNWQVRPQLVLGLEAEGSLAAARGTNTLPAILDGDRGLELQGGRRARSRR